MKTIELIDKYEVHQSEEGDYNPPNYIWVDNTGELIRCKDCKKMDRYTTAPKKYQWDGFCQFWARNTYDDYWCCGAERKEE